MTTIACKIGLTAKPLIDGLPRICLGEYFGNKTDIKHLMELHDNLQYLYPFRGRIIKSDKTRLWVEPTNKEDFAAIQEQYQLTKSCVMENTPVHAPNILSFSSPELYDISCGVPLFDYTPRRKKIYISRGDEVKTIFVLAPYDDPILRGKLIDKCVEVSATCGGGSAFVTFRKFFGGDRVSSGTLSLRYLMKIGVSKEDVFSMEEPEFPRCVDEVLSTLPLMFGEDIVIYFALSVDDMSRYSRLCRERRGGLETRYLC